jgi:hypothetical protein
MDENRRKKIRAMAILNENFDILNEEFWHFKGRIFDILISTVKWYTETMAPTFF